MNFTHTVISQVWNKAPQAEGFNPEEKRVDKCGALIARSSYGMKTRFGWEIDHIIPISKGGSNKVTNLQPLHWENNRSKGDGEDNPSKYRAKGKVK